jgi:hypothetical protein
MNTEKRTPIYRIKPEWVSPGETKYWFYKSEAEDFFDKYVLTKNGTLLSKFDSKYIFIPPSELAHRICYQTDFDLLRKFKYFLPNKNYYDELLKEFKKCYKVLAEEIANKYKDDSSIYEEKSKNIDNTEFFDILFSQLNFVEDDDFILKLCKKTIRIIKKKNKYQL